MVLKTEDTTDIDVLLDEHDNNIVIDENAPDNSLLIEDLGEDVSFAKPPADWAPKAPKTEVGTRRTRQLQCRQSWWVGCVHVQAQIFFENVKRH